MNSMKRDLLLIFVAFLRAKQGRVLFASLVSLHCIGGGSGGGAARPSRMGASSSENK